ncbi:MAG: TIM barrel protein [Anaerolineales bacterium]
MDRPTIAVSAHWHMGPERMEWIAAQNLGLEYTPNPDALDKLSSHVVPFLSAGVPIRYHAFFPHHPLGHVQPEIAEKAVEVHMAALEAIQQQGGKVLTIHIGLDREEPLDQVQVVKDLTRLVETASERGITLCLENLRTGLTSRPETVSAWACASGAMITLDVGHALSCPRVKAGEMTPFDFVDAFQDRIYEAHIYGYENSQSHHPPRDMTVLGPILDRILETQCTWWTIELDGYDDILSTRKLLLEHLGAEENGIRRG